MTLSIDTAALVRALLARMGAHAAESARADDLPPSSVTARRAGFQRTALSSRYETEACPWRRV